MKKTKPRARARPKKKIAIAVGVSANAKTGPVAATYVAQGSCPVTCPHLNNGCYAENGACGIVTRRLNSFGAGLTPDEYAGAEAKAIDKLRGDLDLRLHVVGDCRTASAAQRVATAATRYVARGIDLNPIGACVWTYTHAWQLVPREAWGNVSVLASCETAEQVAAAASRGYAAALVVAKFESQKAYEVDGVTVVPCPHQTRGKQCVSCRLCMDDTHLLENGLAIGFEAHGARRQSVLKSLEVLS